MIIVTVIDGVMGQWYMLATCLFHNRLLLHAPDKVAWLAKISGAGAALL